MGEVPLRSPLRNVEILGVLDKAHTQWYHFTTILVAGCGFFTDAYDLFSISTVTKLLGRLYYYDPSTLQPGLLPIPVMAAVNAMALCGTVLGALFFGFMGDRFGRRKVYGITLFLMIFCSIGSGLSFGSTAKSVMTTLCFFRFWLGFGIGGDYPLSATIMSEYSNMATRGAFVGAVFAMQGFGILFAATIGIIASAVFNRAFPARPFSENHIQSTPPPSDFVWRIILMIGALPALLTLYFRLRLPETARYTALVEGDIAKATVDMERVLDLSNVIQYGKAGWWESKRRVLFSHQFAKTFGIQLLGTCSTWFLLDVAFYSQNLLQNDVLTDVGWLPPPKQMSAVEEMFKIARAQAFIALCATVPGYWISVLLIERMGRRMIQLQGFFFMMVFYLILGLTFSDLRGKRNDDDGTYQGGHHIIFFLLYSVTFFFSNFGPNTTTFIVPAELFPATLRSTCYGLSAAAGKLGAIVGSFGFLYAKQSTKRSENDHKNSNTYPKGIGVEHSFVILAMVNALGCLFTYWWTPETKGKSLEELSGDLDHGIRRGYEALEPFSHKYGVGLATRTVPFPAHHHHLLLRHE